MTRFAVLLALLPACGHPAVAAPKDKAALIQAGLAAGVTACDALLADPAVPATPEAREWCKRLANGCREE